MEHFAKTLLEEQNAKLDEIIELLRTIENNTGTHT